jgi:primosomal protein N' (replication factor Y)
MTREGRSLPPPALPRLVSVAVPVPGLEPLIYRLPAGVDAVPGARVVVPLGRRAVTGLVTAVHPADGDAAPSAPAGLRDLLRVLDSTAFLPEPVVKLAMWIADYYVCSPGEALAAAMPPLAWIESERWWELTDVGRAALARERRVAAARVLETLSDGKGHAVLEIARALSHGEGATREERTRARARADRWLRRLEGEGLVTSAQGLVGRADASRTERTVALTPGARNEAIVAALTPRQRDALEHLRDLADLEDTVAVGTLAQQGVTAAVLGALIRKGLVVVGARRLTRVGHEQLDELAVTGAAAVEGAGAVDLTVEQAVALRDLTAWAEEGAYRTVLLHGVTGSGKTEVYRRLAHHALGRGRRTLILVPEIALTPAVAARFRGGFGERVAVQHSGLSDGERYDQWCRIRRGEVDIVVGTRSAVFAPIDRLGVVIVDEEHDASYKQEESPRYHGRDVALVRAREAGALVVLGSATPSLETYQNVLAGRFSVVRLTRRVLERPLAEVRIVDMREEFAAAGPEAVLSGALREGLAARLAAGEQAIILLNRRGYAHNVFCRQCGDTMGCPSCSVSLTVHRAAGRARCHYCDYARPLPESCPRCGGTYLEYQGVGTERVVGEVAGAFPRARVARLDRDTTRKREEGTRLLRAFGRGEIDVLVGTQMIAKGHDFPGVTLVGVVSADVGLGLPDFRSAERTFQLLTQVAGRAGRGDRAGEAIVQTLFPDHYAVQLARTQDYVAFFEREAEYRRSLRYPPAVWLATVLVRGRTEADARRDAVAFAGTLRDRPGFKVQGPAPAPLSRLRGYYRVQLFLKGTHRAAMRAALRDSLRRHAQLARNVSIDIDPLTVL